MTHNNPFDRTANATGKVLYGLVGIRPVRHTGGMKTYMCLICGFVYSEEEGDLEAGIPPGTRWDDVPLSWRCSDCGAGKEDFQMTEI